ncbi:tyrosine-type recombinase/integrase [Mycobacterium camsae]|uniref:tyrosine-type recombinase/integrase n=1 Tax=Mycobacterium gordonae TaxID=1778 RepID=UPI00197CFA32
MTGQGRHPTGPTNLRTAPAPTPHALRHACASWVLSAGVPMPAVYRHLGHESALMTADI